MIWDKYLGSLTIIHSNPKSLDGFIYYDYLQKLGVDSIGFFGGAAKIIYRDSISVAFYTNI